MKIIAVIVTHNRIDLLAVALKSVLEQSHPIDQVIVIDNQSTDGTQEFLRSAGARVTVVTPRTNTGGAGGYARGMAWADKLGADAIWLMDDDAQAERDCVRALVDGWALYPSAPFVVPAVLDASGSPGRRNQPFVSTDATLLFHSLPDRQAPCLSASFVGPLIAASAARKTHAPLEDFFLWHDDTEYLARLASVTVGRYIPGARVQHRAQTSGPGDFVADRAVRNVRNMLWCVRESAHSAIRSRAWLEMLRSIMVGQVRNAPLRGAAAVTVGLCRGTLTTPRHRTLHEIWTDSRDHDRVTSAGYGHPDR